MALKLNTHIKVVWMSQNIALLLQHLQNIVNFQHHTFFFFLDTQYMGIKNTILYSYNYLYLYPLWWPPHTHSCRLWSTCWWNGYAFWTVHWAESCLQCYYTQAGVHRLPFRQWTSHSPSQHPPPPENAARRSDKTKASCV